MDFSQSCRHLIVLFMFVIIATLVPIQPSQANNSWTVVSSGSQFDSSTGNTKGSDSRRMLAAGTKYATPYFVNDSGKSGPTVMIVGGVHGNERAGYMAARQLTSLVPKRGKVIVIPEANALGVKERARIGEHPGDLNRDFPRTRSARPSSVLARSIWDLVLKEKPDLLLDLHEGYDFHKINSSSVGQSIIYYPKGDTNKIAQAMQSAVNAGIQRSNHKYSLIKYPIKGSLARAAGMFTSTKSMILETSRKQDLDARVNQHVTMVKAALKYLGMS